MTDLRERQEAGRTGDTSADLRASQEAQLIEAWKTPTGWRYWSATNNSEVGKWYATACLVFMLFAGVLALGMRIELLTPRQDFMSADTYNQFYTLHGSAMMFLFAVPIFEAISILLLPAFLGARDLPFPRLSAFGFWCFVIGGVFVLGSVFFDAAPTGGWFMYPPLTTKYSGVGADIWLLGLSFIEVASIAAAVELITGVMKCRPPGMRLNLMPLYAWYVLVVGGMIVFAFPPLIAGDLLFELERELDWPFFDVARGGDPLLWQHLFWIFGHPEVYIVFLPSIAITAMIVPTAAARPILAYSWIVLSAVGTGFLSFGLWVHHMYATGLPSISLGFFSAASEAVVIPTGVQIFVFIATLMVGKVTRSVPLLFIAGALAIFVAGGLTGVMVAIAPFDWQATDTYFIVAHLHYTLFGGMVFPIVAGLYYFFPFISGRMLSERLGVWVFWLMFGGFNLAFFPMHVTGLIGMPRRVSAYPDTIGWQALNVASTVGAFILAVGILLFVYDMFRPVKSKGDRLRNPRPRNPWNAGTLEWTADVPDKPWGIRAIPNVASRYPLWDDPDFVARIDRGEGYLPDAPDHRRETLVTSVLDAKPIHVLRVSGDTWVTFWAAVGIGGLFIFPVFKMYWWAGGFGLFGVAAILWWHWTTTARPPEVNERDAGMGLTLPIYVSGAGSTGWWGVWITMLASATAFICLIFSYFYYWTISPAFPPAGMGGPAPGSHWGGLLMLAGAQGVGLWGQRLNRAGNVAAYRLAFGSAIALAIGGGSAFTAAPWDGGLDPTAHAYPAIVAVIHIWIGAHAAAGVVMLAYCLAKSFAGRLTPEYDADNANVLLYWHFTLGMALVAAAVTGLFPGVAR